MIFDKVYRVHVYETGPDGRLSLYSFFNYLQDIASEHAIMLGFGRDDLMRQNRFWVLSRIYAEISLMPKWEDTIILKTWPNGTDKLFALRNFDAASEDGTHIASATSSWLILDLTTRKVQRPDAILSQFYSDLNPEKSPVRYAGRLEAHTGVENSEQPYKIKVSDLDINLHTNNVRYLTWVSDCYSLDFVMQNVPISAEINYLAESQVGEDIILKTSADKMNGKYFNHSVWRVDDNRELCRIKIGWKSIDGK